MSDKIYHLWFPANPFVRRNRLDRVLRYRRRRHRHRPRRRHRRIRIFRDSFRIRFHREVPPRQCRRRKRRDDSRRPENANHQNPEKQVSSENHSFVRESLSCLKIIILCEIQNPEKRF